MKCLKHYPFLPTFLPVLLVSCCFSVKKPSINSVPNVARDTVSHGFSFELRKCILLAKCFSVSSGNYPFH